jgi:hypothetical protein
MDREDLIKLRDLPDGRWNVDTLYILTREEHQFALAQLVRTWQPDLTRWLGRSEAADEMGFADDDLGDRRVLAVWWD